MEKLRTPLSRFDSKELEHGGTHLSVSGMNKNKFDFVIHEKMESNDEEVDIPKEKIGPSINPSLKSIDNSSNSSGSSSNKEDPNMIRMVGPVVSREQKEERKYASHRDVLVRALRTKPEKKSLTTLSFGNPPKQSQNLKIVGIDALKTIIRSQQISKSNSPTRENDILFNRLNENFLEENFMENEREYIYKTWNHIKLNSLANFSRSHIPYREKKVQLSDFTKKELPWKPILERRKGKHIVRDVCLEYEYSPDYCFNSMVDVLPSTSVVKPIISLIQDRIQKGEKELKHIYRARIFKLPKDSLHSEQEFPLSQSKRKSGYLQPFERDTIDDAEENNLITEPEGQSTQRGEKAVIRHAKAANIDTLHSKRYLVIREGDLLKAKVGEVMKQKSDADLARLHQMMSQAPVTTPRPAPEARRDVYRGRRQVRRNAVYEQSMVDMLFEKYLRDFVEVDKAVVKVTKEDNLALLYEGIRATEMESNNITDLNWSGEQVISRDDYPDYLTNRAIAGLNRQDTLIWIRTVGGVHAFINQRLQRLCLSSTFELLMAACTVLNVVVLIGDGLYPADVYQHGLKVNFVLTFIYQAELILKLKCFGLKWYMRSYVNLVECLVAIMATVEISISTSDRSIDDNKSFIAAFRVLRLTRLLSKLRFMTVIQAVVHETFEQYIYVALLLSLFVFIFGLIGMQVFGGQLIFDDRLPRQNFDSLMSSFFSLFQLLTLENWTDIVEILYKSTVPKWATLTYVFTWIIVGNYIIFNMFLALLLSGFDNTDILAAVREQRDAYKQIQADMVAKYQAQRLESEALRRKFEHQEQDIQEIIDEGKNRNLIMENELFLAEQDKHRQKEKAVYFPIRNTIDDESSLEHLFEQALRDSMKPRRDPRSISNQDLLFERVDSEHALGFLTKDNYFRRLCAFIVTSKAFEVAIIVTIVLSTLTLVIETYLDSPAEVINSSKVIASIEVIYLLIFMIESILKIVRSGLVNERNTYLRDPWSWLELLVIFGSAIDLAVEKPTLQVTGVRSDDSGLPHAALSADRRAEQAHATGG
jgi:hypothetical protein